MKQASSVVASGLSSRLMWTLTKGFRFAGGLRKLFFKQQRRPRRKNKSITMTKKMKEGHVQQMKKKYFKRANSCALRKTAMLRCLGKRAGPKEKLWVWRIQGLKKDVKVPFKNPWQDVLTIEYILKNSTYNFVSN